MPVTRSVGRGRKPSSGENPSTSEGTTATSGTSASATTGTTADTSATGQTTETEYTTTSANVPKLPGTARHQKPTETVDAPVDPQSKKALGSTRSRIKARKIAKAREELLRIQAELAAARLATLETEDSDDELEDEESVYTSPGTAARVDDWLNKQERPPILATTHEPQEKPDKVEDCPVAEIQKQEECSQPMSKTEKVLQAPAGAQGQSDLALLTNALTQAIAAGQRPKFTELPIFSGYHQEWLPFQAAYWDSESSFSTIENINRLRRNLKGKAREAVGNLLHTNTPPADIMKTLESRFGRPEAIATAEIDTLRTLPRLNESSRDICVFSSRVTNAVSALKNLNCANHLNNAEVYKLLVEKLNYTLRFRFFDFLETLPKEEPDLLKFEKFMKKQAELCGPFAPPENLTQPSQAVNQKRSQKINTTVTVTEKQSEQKFGFKCPICEENGHSTMDCKTFKEADVNARWDIAKNRRLCFRCLRYRGRIHSCKPRTCGIKGCKYSHNRMLHGDRSAQIEDNDNDNEEAIESINSAWTTRKQSFLKIIPVQATGPKGSVETFALLDDGSTVTLIDDSIANSIGATGPIDPLRLEAINDIRTAETKSRRVSLTLKGVNNRRETIQARTVKNLRVSPQKVSCNQIKECKHLRDISKMISYDTAKPKILIGQDNWHLLLTTKTRKGSLDQPVASLTPLGWVLHGSHTRTLGRSINFVSHVTETSTEDNIENLIKEYFTMDALCLNPRKPKTDPEQRALSILEENTVHTSEGRYETALLWRNKDVTLPDNYENSLKRLHHIEKKLDRDPDMKRRYTEQMEALIEKGYAEPAPKMKIANRTWYLPHFAVVNPMKPGKLRVVHDAAAKTKGVALNDLLLKGPDLLQSLPGVIMKFRQHKIAVTADIKEMFMQVKLRPEDRDVLRYLWRKDRRDNQPPEEYRMSSLIFGASSSPSTAIYVKNVNARKHEEIHPEAAAAIIQKHYVDDYLDSFRSLEDAVRITIDVREIHKKACFELKQWKSNTPQLLEIIGEKESEEETELYKSEDKAERVLGLIWRPNTDELTFNLNLARIPPPLIEGKTPTKREALRIVMSLFDPLGFASTVTIRAKQILQEVWRRGTSWDSELEEDLAEQWRNWMKHLRSLSEVKIPRQYLQYSDALSLQLHIFTDASESAYSAVLFWRTTLPNGEVNVSLVIAKAKVAPLKVTSIPRLELQAAVMGTRLAEAVIEEHERKPDSKTFWTDSRTVLTWIKTGSRSYKPYVAHRLAAIEDTTTVNEWRWVPTKLNVADDATRDVPVDFGKEHRWYKGPDFLYEDEESWPIEKVSTAEPTGEERVHHIEDKRKPTLSQGLPDVSRFSSWDRLRFTTARVLQFILLCKGERVNYKRTKKNRTEDPDWRKATKKRSAPQATVRGTEKRDVKFLPVSAELLLAAEELLMRSSQEDSFYDEIEAIEQQKPIRKESSLHQLSVEYNGTLRLRSRINAAEEVPEQMKNPIVLDGNHPTVKLWIMAVHRRRHHAGIEATVNECRQQYWILRLRPVTRTLLRQCLHCRMRTQQPPSPRTGDLPPCRLGHHKRPFTYTGVDYFGPMSVSVGRASQKRYVAIFTCLTTRAIHLEIAGSLSTDSAIMALRRMMARRGNPTQIWSDNGTNLKGADRELRRAIDEATAEEAAKKTISWKYIPPGAPFMGGAWERMVRSVKTALTATLHERQPTEEVLSTLLAEVEYTVNSRPLTHVSVDAKDPEALTPNHFLLGGPGRVPVPGNFNDKDTITRNSWRAAQRLADIFWARWIKEYLPDLQKQREPHSRGPEVKVGDLVQLIDSSLPRNIWVRGKVTATYPGPDNVVRTVDVATKGGVLRRPVKKLVILPIENDVLAPEEDATRLHGGRNVQDDAI